MKVIAFLLSVVCLGCSCAAQKVTVAQLEKFLVDQSAIRHSDKALGDRLSHVTLSERLTDRTLARITTETRPGPQTTEWLDLLAAASIFLAPPDAEIPVAAAPDLATQRKLISKAHDFADNALRHLPDFEAVRVTQRFDNTPQLSHQKHAKPKIQLHWVGNLSREITYRSGQEVPVSPEEVSKERDFGLTSAGEFGPFLGVVLSDLSKGTITWSGWKEDATGVRLAVFQYSIPKSASHYLIDFCCYSLSDAGGEIPVRTYPAYHGSLSLDPASGAVREITVEAELGDNAPMKTAAIAVRYGNVEIGGKAYLCPVRSVAIVTTHDPYMEAIDGIGLERHINEVRFVRYHKFGSTARILSAAGSNASGAEKPAMGKTTVRLPENGTDQNVGSESR